MTPTTIIVSALLIIALLLIGLLHRMKRNEACMPVANKLDMSKKDVDYCIDHHIKEYVEAYVNGKINRTEMLQAITSEVQGNYSYAYGIDDREWDYTMRLDPHVTYLEKTSKHEVLIFNEA